MQMFTGGHVPSWESALQPAPVPFVHAAATDGSQLVKQYRAPLSGAQTPVVPQQSAVVEHVYSLGGSADVVLPG